MPQLYASALTFPSEHTVVDMRSQSVAAGGVFTFTCADANGADVAYIVCTASTGGNKFNVQHVGEAAPSDPTSYNTQDATGIGHSFAAHTPLLLYASRPEGMGKRKILAIKIFAPVTGGQMAVTFLNVKTGVELNG